MAECKHKDECPMINRPYEVAGAIAAQCYWLCGIKDIRELINGYDPHKKERR